MWHYIDDFCAHYTQLSTLNRMLPSDCVLETTVLLFTNTLWIRPRKRYYCFKKVSVGPRSILWGHWYPLFPLSDDSAHGFQSQGDFFVTYPLLLLACNDPQSSIYGIQSTRNKSVENFLNRIIAWNGLSANVRVTVLWLLLAWDFHHRLLYGTLDPINATHSI